MSFALPKNVPSFDSTQRLYDDTVWRHAGGAHQNGHTTSGIGITLSNIFAKKDGLPMYKDKPHTFPASGRSRAFFRRKRIWLGGTLVFFGTLYLFGAFSPLGRTEGVQEDHGTPRANWWDWIQSTSPDDDDVWESRREKVKEAFTLSWDGYAQYAWGYDEYHPVSKQGHQMAPSGMGWIIVDALDTLMIMNLTSRLSHARQWISTSLNYDQDTEVNTFETTIRMLGGLLSAHYLSTTFPDMAPLVEDDNGKPGEDLYLEKAADLADRLLGAFDSRSGIPYASVNLQTLRGVPSGDDGGASSTAEAASLQLEFKYLAMLMGEKAYWEKVEKVIQVIDDNGMEDGLLPIFIYPDQGTFRGDNIRLGSRGDSYYEYLIKQYLQTSKQEPVYLELWRQALHGVRKHLITYSKSANLTILAERPAGLESPLLPKMDHLVCFMPGTIALAATEGLTHFNAKKQTKRPWTKQDEEDLELALELTKTCWGMYKVMTTGLAAEISHFEVDDPPHMMIQDGKLKSLDIFGDAGIDDVGNITWQHDYVIKHQDAHNLQRPETVESLFYMWRITGDVMYREWGWEMFKSFVRYTSVEDGGGFTSLSNANVIPPVEKDNMESFWLAETLKYFYLLFSPHELLPLDTIVINTEAHIFPRFELQKNLRTGWTRKPRSKDGRIIIKEADNIGKEMKKKGVQDDEAQRIREGVKQKPNSKTEQLLSEERAGIQKSSKKGSNDLLRKKKEIGVNPQMTTVAKLATSTIVVDVEKATYAATAKRIAVEDTN